MYKQWIWSVTRTLCCHNQRTDLAHGKLQHKYCLFHHKLKLAVIGTPLSPPTHTVEGKDGNEPDTCLSTDHNLGGWILLKHYPGSTPLFHCTLYVYSIPYLCLDSSYDFSDTEDEDDCSIYCLTEIVEWWQSWLYYVVVPMWACSHIRQSNYC